MHWNLTEIVMKIIGEFRAYGSSEVDEKRYERLDEIDNLLFYLINDLIVNAEQKDHYVASIKKIGKRSYEILMDRFEQIKRVCE
jgi:hypothetical protein